MERSRLAGFFGMGLAAATPGAAAGGCGCPPVEIRQVTTRRDLGRFVTMPWRIYRGDPQWVPPLLIDVKEFLDRRKHPFYRHGEAAQFLALSQGEAVGRILASDDPRYNQKHGSNVGCFGMFESVDEQPVAHALLDAAAAWLRARGRAAIIGPIDYSINYNCGLLVDGFHTPPRFMMNHNPPYYAPLLESWGLTKVKDLYGWWFVDKTPALSKWRSRVGRLAERCGVVIRPFSRAHFEEEVRKCQAVYCASRQDQWGFIDLTEAEFLYFAERLNRVGIPELVLTAEVDGRPVGFALSMPDINEAIRPLNGRLTTCGIPLGLCRFLYRLRRVKTARMLVLGVLEGYRRRGIGELLILKSIDHAMGVIGYRGAELSWTLEDNQVINRTIESVGGQRYKTYRIYGKPLSANVAP